MTDPTIIEDQERRHARLWDARHQLEYAALVDADPSYWAPRLPYAPALKEAAHRFNDAHLRYEEAVRRNGDV